MGVFRDLHNNLIDGAWNNREVKARARRSFRGLELALRFLLSQATKSMIWSKISSISKQWCMFAQTLVLNLKESK